MDPRADPRPDDDRLRALLSEDRPSVAEPERIGRHDVLVERSPFGTGVYLVRGGRVLVSWARHGYREDVAEAPDDPGAFPPRGLRADAAGGG
ncbi:hypothetical protein [Actinomadura atramentaria]|uniref:hypothetical protein n=1 Tax=Actinomadura atramentaria TaxID=1990 RepID=UPI0003A13B95|nr:hypothetical protein [Actinomadura atramentaria]